MGTPQPFEVASMPYHMSYALYHNGTFNLTFILSIYRTTTGTLRISSEDQLQEKLLDESDDDQL